MHVASLRDRDPGAFGEVQFVDVETGERREIDVTPQLRGRLRRRRGTRTPRRSKQFCGRYDIGYLRADAEQPFEDIVLKAFRQGRFVA